jgi:uncharacterized protein YhfF
VLAALRKTYPDAVTFHFGDSDALCRRLNALVISGKKTATCSDARDFDNGCEALPTVGRVDIALNWDDTPALVIKTLEVTRKRFCDVGAGFALAEGENETLEGWRRDHQAFFERTGYFSPEMDLICERFELVDVL